MMHTASDPDFDKEQAEGERETVDEALGQRQAEGSRGDAKDVGDRG